MAASGVGADGPTANGESASSSNGGGKSGSGGGTSANAALATLLRDCAYHVERDQFHPALYQALAQLHAYAGERAGRTPSPAPPAGYHRATAGLGGAAVASAAASAAATTNGAGAGVAGPKPAAASTAAAHHQRQASADIASKSSYDDGGTFDSGAGAAGRTRDEEDYLKDIKKEFKAIGKQFKKFGVGVGLTTGSTSTPAKPGGPAGTGGAGGGGAGAGAAAGADPEQTMGDDTLDHLRDAARRTHDSSEWCEKHFCMGCGCKNGAAWGASSGPRRRAAPSAEGEAAAAGGISGGGNKAESSAPATATATAAGSAAAGHADKATAASAPSKLPAKPCFHRPNNPNSNLIANGWIEQQRRSKMRIVWKDILASLVEGRRPGEETTLWIQRQIANAATGKAELEALHQIPMKWLEDVNYLDFYGDHRFSLKIYNVADEFQFRTSDEASAKNWVATLVRARDASLGRARNAGPTAQEAKSMNPLDDWGNEGQQQQQQQQAPPPAAARTASSETAASGGGGGGSDAGSANAAEAPAAPAASGGAPTRMSIKELRAIAHGAGINTYGMERADLERIAARIGGTTSPSTAVPQPPPSAPAAPASGGSDADAAASQRQEAAARAAAVEKSRQEAAAARQAAAAERQRQEQEALRIRQEQWARQQEAHTRAAAEAKQREEAAAAARAAEQQRQWQAQQQAWQQQQAQQQQWQQQQAQQQARAQQQQWQQAQQQAPPPPPPGAPGGPQYQQQQPGPQSPVNMKYSKMTVEQTEEAEQATITRIKREILVNWALVPPMYQMLRPINQLIVSIHNSFPPAFGVASHDYFAKWKPITPDSISLNSHPDDEKIKKAVRKVRFFLHPDKLPRDLNAEQSFMCRMLWDVTSDSWEEHLKQKDELDWIK
eukprot:CAMPEP_0181064312 /NCGR_PEP_ID=MMETSP1070-20121207/24136_1 /TAXON_ID=265543 /ORGANISM="Minutocellus polymorphus, Strain NH13" /LENGTH=893 /DNA_ID=CAMNT_0023144623 /DNA_START=282 /DNA_END=2963 /DNA_ORIENTATION=-